MQYCKECDPDGLVNLCRQESDFLEAGINLLSQSYNKEVSKQSLYLLGIKIYRY